MQRLLLQTGSHQEKGPGKEGWCRFYGRYGMDDKIQTEENTGSSLLIQWQLGKEREKNGSKKAAKIRIRSKSEARRFQALLGRRNQGRRVFVETDHRYCALTERPRNVTDIGRKIKK